MNLLITYDHTADTLQDSVLVNGKTLSDITGDMESVEESILDKTIELFDKIKCDHTPVNSEMIARTIAQKFTDDNETDVITVVLLSGAKVYNLSSQIRTMALDTVLRSRNSNLSIEVEKLELCDYITNKFKYLPITKNIIIIMTVGLLLGAIAELIDIVEPEGERELKSFPMVTLN